MTSDEHEGFALSGDSKRKVFELVRYLLCQDKRKFLIRKQDINKNVLKEQAKSFQPIFQETQKCLKHIFGIDIVECELNGKAKGYLLINRLGNGNEHISSEPNITKNYGLLMIVLSLIYMSSGILSDDLLKRTLRQLGIPLDLQTDDVSKAIQQFIKQSYIVRERVVKAEASTYQYKLGVRSQTETSKRKILEFISEVYGVEISQWKLQYKEVLSEEGTADR